MKEKGLMTSAEFFRLLRRRGAKDGNGIDALIESRGNRNQAMLMMDASAFTRRAHEHGIIQFLAVLTYCFDRLIPLLKKRGGTCINRHADNILAAFPAVDGAVQAAVDIQRWLARYNAKRPEREQFHVCIGLHFGKVLRLKDGVFGEHVNVAAKVGEDLADKDEILATREIYERGRGLVRIAYARTSPIGGRMVELFRVRWS